VPAKEISMDPKRQWGVAAFIAIASASQVTGQSTVRASVDSSGVQGNSDSFEAAISRDGRYVAFMSRADDLVPSDTNNTTDVFVRDLLSGVTTLASIDPAGVQMSMASGAPSISADGRYVAFHMTGEGHVFPERVIWVRDLQGGVTRRASVDSSGVPANDMSSLPSISADGRYVAFASYATNLVPGDTNGKWDVFVHDFQTGITSRASVDDSGAEGNDHSGYPNSGVSISADGRYVAFGSYATNLVPGDTNLRADVFVRDLQLGVTRRASVDSSGAQGNDHSGFHGLSLSADGRFVAYCSLATNLVHGDTNGVSDVFVRDLQGGVTLRASVDSSGAQGDTSWHPSISSDGRYVAFDSVATDFVPGDTNGHSDVFVRDLQSGVTTRISVASSGAQANFESNSPSLSADGRSVAFVSGASNLVAGDTNSSSDIFVRDWQQPATVATCFGDGSAGACPCGNSGHSRHGCENSQATGGSQLTARGTRRLSEDTFVLTSAGELPSVLSIFLQGNASVAPLVYGDGLRCIGGTLKRLYAKNAIGGVASAPEGSEPSVSERSSALGDAIPAGATRWYQVFYRDPNPTFCPNPPGNTWNISSGVQASWGF
jgi:Tol biopolymer transport system component